MIAGLIDIAEDMRREEDGAALLTNLIDKLQHFGTHAGVEVGCGFVEHDQRCAAADNDGERLGLASLVVNAIDPCVAYDVRMH